MIDNAQRRAFINSRLGADNGDAGSEENSESDLRQKRRAGPKIRIRDSGRVIRSPGLPMRDW